VTIKFHNISLQQIQIDR